MPPVGLCPNAERYPLTRIRATQGNASSVRRFLRRLTQPIQSFTRLLSNARASDRARIQIPGEFITAWLHIVMGLVQCTLEYDFWREHTENAETLLKTGMRKVIEGLSDSILLDRASVLPFELVSLACLGLFDGMTANQRDISETYYDYLQALVSQRTLFIEACIFPACAFAAGVW
jgi:hypothetical protein